MPITRVEELAQQARFIFTGLVVKLNAATMPEVPITDRVAIVRVDEITQAPEMLSNWKGKEITVQLSARGKVIEGQRYVFFTNGWLFGESIAVQALAQRPAEQMTRDLSRGSDDPVQMLADRELQAHVAQVDLIVLGKVSTVRLPETQRRLTSFTPHGPFTDKDPEWREAVIEIESTEKGKPPGPQVIAKFPASIDIAWYQAPKLKPGDEGIFLLHTKDEGELDESTEANYSCLHELDYQPLIRLEQIRMMIKAVQPARRR